MKKNEKQMILVIVVILAVIIGIIFLLTRGNKDNNAGQADQLVENQEVEKYVQVLEDGTKLNTSTKLNETKNVDGLEISNIQFTMSNGQTLLLADVKNNSGKDVGVTAIDIVLYDDTGAEITTIHGILGNVKNGETTKLQTETTLDFANAYDFKVVIK